STSPYSFQLNTWTISNGAHSLQAKAQDLAGNQSFSSVVTVNVANSTPSTLSDGLVGYWNFDDAGTSIVSDSTEFHNDGTPMNGVLQVVGGKWRSAFGFDGVDDYIS